MKTVSEQRKAAKRFAEIWRGKGYEKGQSQKFWLALLQDVYGVEYPSEYVRFEDQVKLDHTSFIDCIIPTTHVLIEQKSLGKNLLAPIKQSDGSLLTPYGQAKRYSAELPYSERPRWIVTCNFSEFNIYDMERPSGEPEIVYLKDLEKDYYRLNFLVDTEDHNIKKEMEVSLQAGELVGLLYDALLKQYHNPDDPEVLQHLNILCVRLVFCLYAEDAGLFGRHNMFHDYLSFYKDRGFRDALIKLFCVLDQKSEDRDPYLEDELAAFPYVNGGLFEKEDVIIPKINDEIIDIILNKMSSDFDWSMISPTIFGAVFESTLNPESRRAGGMHYTSIENIHKVIDPLFLNDLKEEFVEAKALKVANTRKQRLLAFQSKLASLTFLDPAAGSGNFLTETYISLRRLENEVLKELSGGQMMLGNLGEDDYVKVTIKQFYGIEINDFAVTVARTALWIAESQMLKETEDIIHAELDFLPLKSFANIVEGNALRMDWEEVVPKNVLNYIMGNPPFIGHQWRSADQVEDMKIAFYDLPKHGKLDYVCAWYNKAIDLMKDSTISAAFVSTNSICQGESAPILGGLLASKNVEIQFAFQTFVWSSEAHNKAAVHCVIIGFTAYKKNSQKLLFSKSSVKKTDHINGYLIEAPDVYIQARGKLLTSGIPMITKGSQPTDNQGLILDTEAYQEFCNRYPNDLDLVKRYVGSYEYINNKMRYCFWLKDISPKRYANNKYIIDRLKIVKEFRETSSTASVRNDANTPYLFTQIRQPDTNYLIMPRVSSENRQYIPIGFIDKNVIASDAVLILPDATTYLFGIVSSNVHMAWMRTVAGRLKSDFRYSPSVYNNFPWPEPTDAQKQKIERTAQMILDARELYPDASLADLYDPLTMPPELRKAHQENDKAVMEAYGFNWRKMSASECVAELMKLYQKLTEKE